MILYDGFMVRIPAMECEIAWHFFPVVWTLVLCCLCGTGPYAVATAGYCTCSQCRISAVSATCLRGGLLACLVGAVKSFGRLECASTERSRGQYVHTSC